VNPLPIVIQEQPDPESCGPTCLQAIYDFYSDHRRLSDILEEVHFLDEGGTLEVLLGCHALRQGYTVTIYTYNLALFDPTWFALEPMQIHAKLQEQAQVKLDRKFQIATHAYQSFLEMGGRLRMTDLSGGLLRKYLKNGTPLLAGLSATYLYQSCRERAADCADDDVRGTPVGHFVVLCGCDPTSQSITIADPYPGNPMGPGALYDVSMDRLVCSILLGMVTYDANLLVIEPQKDADPKAGN
jgi:hypothetical protein